MFRNFSAGLFACLCLLAISGANAEPGKWPIKEFRIVQSDPYSEYPDPRQDHHRKLTDDELTAIFDMEVFLTEVAQQYEAMGFRAPELRLLKGKNGGEAYKINFFDYDDFDDDDETSPFRVRRVTGSITEIQIDSSRPFQEDGIPFDRTYEHLAHELFHIVQRAYQPSRYVIQGDWIIEGQAQAMGMYMLESLLGKDPYAGNAEDYRLGGRSYAVPLPDWEATGLHDGAYRTSSFWRYIAEHYAASKKNGRAGIVPIEPDYRYLVEMYKIPYASSASRSADLFWTDQGLRESTGLGLDRIYANFISTFADFVPARMTRTPEGSVADAKDGWLNFLFGECSDIVNLTATFVSGDVLLQLDRNASGCFKAEVWGEGQADLSIHVHSENADKIAALRVGTRGGTKVGSPVLIAPVPGGGYIGQWRFNIEAGEPQVFIVSNVAQDPRNTGKMDVLFNVSSGYWDSNLTTPRQTASTGSGSTTPRAAPKPLARDKTREEAAEELSNGLSTLSNRSANSVDVSQDYETRGCVREAFAETGCGPTTSINLTLMPGPFADGYQTTGTGGGLAQVMSQFTAIADNGALTTDRALTDAFEQAAAMEGSSVQIQIPAIDYGFTGTFTDARIEVNGGDQNGEFEARGPADIQIGRGRLYLSSGNVTIDEFTPFMLRGSFQAQLTDLSSIDFSAFGVDESLPVQREIQGRFAITAPWEGDDRLQVYPVAGNTAESAMEDLYEVFPAARNFDIEELGAINPDAGGSNGTGYAVGTFPVSEIIEMPTCNCGCQIDRSQPRACLKICKPKILSCGQANQLAERFNTARSEQTALADDEVQRNAANPPKPTREEYIAGLKENGIPPDRIEFLMKEMDAFWAQNGGWPER